MTPSKHTPSLNLVPVVNRGAACPARVEGDVNKLKKDPEYTIFSIQ